MVLAKLRKPFKKEPTITHLIFSFKICISVVLNYKVTSIQNNLIKMCIIPANRDSCHISTSSSRDLAEIHGTCWYGSSAARQAILMWFYPDYRQTFLLSEYWIFAQKLLLKPVRKEKNKTPFYFIMREYLFKSVEKQSPLCPRGRPLDVVDEHLGGSVVGRYSLEQLKTHWKFNTLKGDHI